jgi:hypothetical protein
MSLNFETIIDTSAFGTKTIKLHNGTKNLMAKPALQGFYIRKKTTGKNTLCQLSLEISGNCPTNREYIHTHFCSASADHVESVLDSFRIRTLVISEN